VNRLLSLILILLTTLLLTLAPGAALAQVDEQPDAGTQGPGGPPDAGGDEEEEDTTGRIVEVCRDTPDCSPRFVCDNGRCRYNGTREAERVGCMFGPQATLLLVGVGLAVGAGRRRSS
jgi:hypothetical protein